MTIVETKLNTLITTYDKLVKGIDDQAAMSRDRAYGGVIRAGKGELVESLVTHLVQIAWEDVLHQNRGKNQVLNAHNFSLLILSNFNKSK